MSAILTGKRLRLRPASADDVEARLSLGNPAKIVETFGVDPDDVRPMAKDDAT